MGRNSIGYEEDFAAWSAEQAQRIRLGDWAGVDAENVAEEIESLGRSDKRELGSRLKVLLAHLLKWQHQPKKRSKSWEQTILEQRQAIDVLLEESPSLVPTLKDRMDKAYGTAKESAAYQTRLVKKHFPETCPYSVAEVLDKEFLPE